jgi:hypothetical protein
MAAKMEVKETMLPENNKNIRLYKLLYNNVNKLLYNYELKLKEEDLKIYDELNNFINIIFCFLTSFLKSFNRFVEKIEGKPFINKIHFDDKLKILIIDLLTKIEYDIPFYHFHRIAIKFNLFLSKETIKDEEELLKEIAFKWKYPAGVIDSYTLIFAALYNLDFKSFFKAKKQSNVLICYIIPNNKNCCSKKRHEIFIERFFKILDKFYRHRIEGMLIPFNFEEKFYKYANIQLFPKEVIGVFRKIDNSIANMLKRFLLLLSKISNWFKRIENKYKRKPSIIYNYNPKEEEGKDEKLKLLDYEIKKYRKVPILFYIKSTLLKV